MTISAQEFAEILSNSTIYQCRSATCSDNGAVCISLIHMGYELPTSCLNPDAFSGDDDIECDCRWVEL